MTLTELQIDYQAANERRWSVVDQFTHVKPTDLVPLTNDIFDRIAALLVGVNDVTFIPARAASDGEDEWNLAHVICHLTAGLEENACSSSILARGAELSSRARAETDWEMVGTSDQLDQRLAESRRITLAYLGAWPDQPNLQNIAEHAYFGPLNCVAQFVIGVVHARSHLEQIAKLVRETP